MSDETKAIRARLAAATPGPWARVGPHFGDYTIRQDPPDWDGHGYQMIATAPADKKGTHYGDMFSANADLIASAPTDIAYLLAENERLTAQAERLRFVMQFAHDNADRCGQDASVYGRAGAQVVAAVFKDALATWLAGPLPDEVPRG